MGVGSPGLWFKLKTQILGSNLFARLAQIPTKGFRYSRFNLSAIEAFYIYLISPIWKVCIRRRFHWAFSQDGCVFLLLLLLCILFLWKFYGIRISYPWFWFFRGHLCQCLRPSWILSILCDCAVLTLTYTVYRYNIIDL